MSTVSERRVVVNGISCLVRESGDPSAAEAVVMVHGNPGSSLDFEGLLSPVGDVARVVAPDMPGYGKADRPRNFRYTVEGYGQHLAALMDELGIAKAHLVLHDFGGAWGLDFAARQPDRVASFVLFNMGVLPGYRWHKFARIWRTPILGELFWLIGTRRAFKFLMNADNPKPLPDAFVDRMYDDADWPMKRGVLALYRATSNLGEFAEHVGAVLAPLRRPALVIWGEGDAYLPVRYAEIQKQYFAAEVHVLDNAGHWPMIDEPERVRALTTEFLRRQVG